MSHVHHRLGQQDDFREYAKVKKVPKVPGFSIFWGKSLCAFRHFPNANFPHFRALFPLKEEGVFREGFSRLRPKTIVSAYYLYIVCVTCTPSTGQTGRFSGKGERGRKCRKCRNFRYSFGKSLGAFRHFPNANFPTFRTLFPLKGGSFLGEGFFPACGAKL